MARQLGTSNSTVRIALHQLRDEGLLVKRLVERPAGKRVAWVPAARALAYTRHPDADALATQIARRAARERWTVLPSQRKIHTVLGVSQKKALAAREVLIQRGILHKLRVDGQWRWCFVPPHRLRQASPRATMAVYKTVVDQVLSLIRAGEFRYRTPDGTIHERPFLSQTEMMALFLVGTPTVAKARKILVDLGWIVPGESNNSYYRLADTVPPVARTTHPAPRAEQHRLGAPPSLRYLDIADDLIARIQAGDFAYRAPRLPWQVELSRHYKVHKSTIRRAVAELHRRGWIDYYYFGPQPCVRLADPLPEAA